jgi:hypothetical protein
MYDYRYNLKHIVQIIPSMLFFMLDFYEINFFLFLVHLPRSITPGRILSASNNSGWILSKVAGILTTGLRRSDPTRSAQNATESCRILSDFAGFRRYPDRNPVVRIAWPGQWWIFRFNTVFFWWQSKSNNNNDEPFCMSLHDEAIDRGDYRTYTTW